MSAARKLREGSLVLKGATVADLLIEQPTKFQLVIDGTDGPSHRVDDPPIDSHCAMSETAASDVVLPSERQKFCAGCGCRVQLAVTHLDPSGTEMTLHCDADMVRAIVGARQVKFLSGPAGSQGQHALAEARCAGFASR
jgi:hypothetical protein